MKVRESDEDLYAHTSVSPVLVVGTVRLVRTQCNNMCMRSKRIVTYVGCFSDSIQSPSKDQVRQRPARLYIAPLAYGMSTTLDTLATGRQGTLKVRLSVPSFPFLSSETRWVIRTAHLPLLLPHP